MKRYWSLDLPFDHWATHSKEEKAQWDAVDNHLTPQDVIDMQTIDADCNDCIHFKRGQMVWRMIIQKDKQGVEKEVRAAFGHYCQGHCLKFDMPTEAYAGQFTGHECFQHRRAA